MLFALLPVIILFGVLPLWGLLRLVVDKRQLRRFPTPSIFAYTPFWLMYQSSQGRRYRAIHKAHQELGPVVRISSNHVSFIDPAAFKEIYNYGSKIQKDDFYETIAAGNPSMAQTASKELHGAKRRNLAHVFSAQRITDMQPRILKVIEKLTRNVGEKSQQGAFDLRPWLNMFSFDAVTSIFWSQSYGFLDKGEDVCSTQLSTGEVVDTHAMNSYQSAVHFNVICAQMSTEWYNIARKVFKHAWGQRAGDYFVGMAKHLVNQRIRNKPAEPDLFSSLPMTATEKRPVPMTFDQVHAESTTMLDAGNDTTQISLTNMMYHLARYPHIQTRLRSELTKILGTNLSPPAGYEVLCHIPYLRACLDESFRLRTPLAFGLPRKVIQPGVTISGYEIYPGTTISAPIYTLHHNPSLFSDCESFIPERWLPNDTDLGSLHITSDQEYKNLKDFVLPFSLGSRACIGRNLAYMELSCVITALVREFEWELEVPGSEMRTFERFNCGNVELMVKARRIERPLVAVEGDGEVREKIDFSGVECPGMKRSS